MKHNKKIKIISLTLTAVILAAGFGIYLFNTEDKMKTSNNLESMEAIELEENNIDSIQSYTQFSDSLILIRGGSFNMGSSLNERQRDRDEAQHTVTINSFYVDPYEVTQKDYRDIMGNNPSHFSGDNLPVENVTWFDAINYCNRLSERRGLTPVYTIEGSAVRWNRNANGYRLLTEAEWEYAARAGTTTVFNNGNQITSANANFYGNYPYLIEENYVNRKDSSVVTSSYRGSTINVNSLPANQFGLYNMHGNVSEWCFDYYGDYGTGNATNPAGAVSGSLRVNRGGGYNDFGKHLCEFS